MQEIERVVNDLEQKILLVIAQNNELKSSNEALQVTLNKKQELINTQEEQIKTWQEQYQSLKIANNLLGSNNDKKETKLKINMLIREIDSCIAQLSE